MTQRRFLAALSLALTGCGSQAGPGYAGEPLLSFGGQVVLQDAETSGSLVPVLGFGGGSKEIDGHELSGIYLEDVTVRGSFPASFELFVFDPPSEHLLLPTQRKPGSPRIAIGMISAATPDHPAFLPDRNGSDVALCNPDQISGCFHEVLFCPSYFLPEFSFAERTYIDPEGVCFRQRSICDDSTFESCTLESTSGDPQFSKPLWHHTAGLSHNYAVVYFDAAIAAGSVLSKVIGGGQAIDAGYHLVHGREATLDEFHSSEDCRQQVMASMLSEYNAANGTYLRYVDDLPDQDAAKLDLITRMQDEGCSLAFLDGFYEIVAPGDDQHVSIELSVTSGPDLPFPFFAVL